MTTLHLIRHGQTNWNAERRIQGQSESELDETGKQQAAKRRPLLEEIEISAVYSSTSVRTRQTTAILTQNMRHEVTYLDSLREIFLGPWETQLWDDIHNSEPEAAECFHTRPHEFRKADAENYQQLRDRGVAALEHIIQSETQGHILVVSHGALLKAAMTHYAGVELRAINNIPGLANCSHSVLEAGPGNKRVLQTVAGVPFAETEWQQTVTGTARN